MATVLAVTAPVWSAGPMAVTHCPTARSAALPACVRVKVVPEVVSMVTVVVGGVEKAGCLADEDLDEPEEADRRAPGVKVIARPKPWMTMVDPDTLWTVPTAVAAVRGVLDDDWVEPDGRKPPGNRPPRNRPVPNPPGPAEPPEPELPEPPELPERRDVQVPPDGGAETDRVVAVIEVMGVPRNPDDPDDVLVPAGGAPEAVTQSPGAIDEMATSTV